MTHHHAQVNCGIQRAGRGDLPVGDFAEEMFRINGLAARSPGWTWRAQHDRTGAARRDPGGPPGGSARTPSTRPLAEDAFGRACLHHARLWRDRQHGGAAEGEAA